MCTREAVAESLGASALREGCSTNLRAEMLSHRIPDIPPKSCHSEKIGFSMEKSCNPDSKGPSVWELIYYCNKFWHWNIQKLPL